MNNSTTAFTGFVEYVEEDEHYFGSLHVATLKVGTRVVRVIGPHPDDNCREVRRYLAPKSVPPPTSMVRMKNPPSPLSESIPPPPRMPHLDMLADVTADLIDDDEVESGIDNGWDAMSEITRP